MSSMYMRPEEEREWWLYDKDISSKYNIRHQSETLLEGLSIPGQTHKISRWYQINCAGCIIAETDWLLLVYSSCPLITFSYLLYPQTCLKGLFALNLVCILSYRHAVTENVIYCYAVLSVSPEWVIYLIFESILSELRENQWQPGFQSYFIISVLGSSYRDHLYINYLAAALACYLKSLMNAWKPTSFVP